MTIRTLTLLVCAMPTLVMSQTADESFETFRRQIHADYGRFRQGVLEDYDKYLQQVWEEYEAFSGFTRDFGSKPQRPPHYIPEVGPTPIAPLTPAPAPQALPPVPAPPAVPMPEVSVTVDFYGAKLALPVPHFSDVSLGGRDDTPRLWRQLKDTGVARLAAQIQRVGQKRGLSDWGIVLLADRYVSAALPSGSADTRIAVLHFLTANMGYDIRLASAAGRMRLLVPYAQKVYEQSRLDIGGRTYYVWPDARGSVCTCRLPDNAGRGKQVDLLFHGSLHLGGESRPFCLEAAGMRVSGSVDVPAMRLVDDYPMVDVPTCAKSVLCRSLRDAVVEQLAASVQGLDEQEAARRLLNFCQHCFSYATDGEQFGHEKPFYFEESLYYLANDCEDRAIFYAWLVRNILHLNVHLIHYPGHECTAVAFTDPTPEGTSYVRDGKAFYICDPTYIGADIGVCMPQFRRTKPEVEP